MSLPPKSMPLTGDQHAKLKALAPNSKHRKRINVPYPMYLQAPPRVFRHLEYLHVRDGVGLKMTHWPHMQHR